jgi:hypothetical protein
LYFLIGVIILALVLFFGRFGSIGIRELAWFLALGLVVLDLVVGGKDSARPIAWVSICGYDGDMTWKCGSITL